MASQQNTGRRLAALVPLQLAVMLIGLRCAFLQDPMVRIAGWVLVVGSLMALFGYSLFFWRTRRS